MNILLGIFRELKALVTLRCDGLAEEKKQTALLEKIRDLLIEIRDKVTVVEPPVEEAVSIEIPEGPVVEQP